MQLQRDSVPKSNYTVSRDTDPGFTRIVTGRNLLLDLGANNPDNNIIFRKPDF